MGTEQIGHEGGRAPFYSIYLGIFKCLNPVYLIYSKNDFKTIQKEKNRTST